MFDLKPMTPGDYSGAANLVDHAGIYGALQRNKPKVEKIIGAEITNNARERNLIREAEASLHSQGMNSMASIKSAGMIADAQVKAAKAQAAAASSSATMGGIGSIIGAGLSLFSDRDTKENVNRIDDALSLLRQLSQ